MYYLDLLFSDCGIFVVGLLTLAFLAPKHLSFTETQRKLLLFMHLPSLAALGMFSLVNVNRYYLGPFMALLFISLLLRTRLTKDKRRAEVITAITLAVSFIALLPIVINSIDMVRLDLKNRGEASPKVHIWIAKWLKQKGIHPGDRVAHVGELADSYWARLARVQVVANAEPAAKFWQAEHQDQLEVMSAFARVGAKAVIAKSVPEEDQALGWQKIKGTYFYFYPLYRPSTQ
jgi:hypothetical protein